MAIFLNFANIWSLGAQNHVAPKDSIPYYIDNSDYAKALKTLQFFEKQYLRNKQYQKLADNLVTQSSIFYKLNDSERALEVAFRGLKQVRNKSQISSEIILLRQIGIIYGNRQDYKAAMKKLGRAMKLASTIENDSLTDLLYQSLYRIHSAVKSDSSVYFLKKTMEISKRKNNPEALFTAYNNSFFHYFNEEKYDIALKYVDSARTQAYAGRNKEFKKIALNNMAGLYYRTGNYVQSKKTFQELFRLDPADSTSMDASDRYFNYSGVLSMLGEYKEAFDYIDKAYSIREDNYNASVTSAVRDVETKYRLQQIEEKRIRDIRKQNEMNLRERRIFFIIIAVAIITIILLYFFYQNNRLKQKNRLNQIESETQQKLLSATLDAREIERRHIASVLHDSVSALLSSAGLQLTAFDSVHGNTSEEISKTRQILKEAHDKVRGLSHELVPTLLSKFGLAYALQDLCEKHSSKQIEFEYKDDGSIKRYDEDFEMKIYFITSELLNNALKHSKASKAILEISASNGILGISLSDNGQGFDTSKPGSEGFGLTQIRARISALKGKFSVSSKPDSGTTASISVPLP